MTEEEITTLVSEFEAAVQCQARVDAVPSLARVYVAYDVEAAANTLRERLISALRDARQDGARLDWLEANGRALMCWNVSDDPTEEHWHAPMSPNNGWTVSPLDPEDGEDYQGNTARDAIDWAIKSERASVASSGTPGEQQQTFSDAPGGETRP